VADILTAESPAPASLTSQVAQQAEAEAGRYYGAGTGEMMKGRMPELVKGAGFVGPGGNAPLTDYTDIMGRASDATLRLRMETHAGFRSKSSVVKSLNPDFLNQFGAFKTALLQPSFMEQMEGLVSLLPGGGEAIKNYANKSFTAGNLGVGSVYGLTPFNLVAPSRLIYPVEA
jgi:hypothetical protein